MSIPGENHIIVPDYFVPLKDIYPKQTTLTDTVNRRLEHIYLFLKRYQDFTLLSDNLIPMDFRLEIPKDAGVGAIDYYTVNRTLQIGSEINLTCTVTAYTAQPGDVPITLRIRNELGSEIFDQTQNVNSSGVVSFSISDTTTVLWQSITIEAEITGAFTNAGEDTIGVYNIELTTSRQVGAANIKVAAFVNGERLLENNDNNISNGYVAQDISTAGQVYDFVFPTTNFADKDKELSFVVFVEGDTSEWTGNIASGVFIAIGVEEIGTYPSGKASYYLDGQWTDEIPVLGGSDSDLYFEILYHDNAPQHYIKDFEWDCDCSSQNALVSDLVEMITAWQTESLTKINRIVQVEENRIPSIVSFQNQIEDDLDENDLLLWHNTEEGSFGAQFIYHNGVIYQNQNEFTRGYGQKILFAYSRGTQSATYDTIADFRSNQARYIIEFDRPTQLIIKANAIITTTTTVNLLFDYGIIPYGQTLQLADMQSTIDIGSRGLYRVAASGSAAYSYYNHLIQWIHPTILDAGRYELYLGFWGTTAGGTPFQIALAPSGNTTNSSFFDRPALEFIDQWQIQ